MAKQDEIEVGRLAIFHARDKRIGGPDFEGTMEGVKGKYYVKLWRETKPNLTNGEMFKGYIYSVKPKE